MTKQARRDTISGPFGAFFLSQELDMRSHYCHQIGEQQIGERVTLCGWVRRRRDHGGVIFLDLRDREGLVQIVVDPDRPEAFASAEE